MLFPFDLIIKQKLTYKRGRTGVSGSADSHFVFLLFFFTSIPTRGIEVCFQSITTAHVEAAGLRVH